MTLTASLIFAGKEWLWPAAVGLGLAALLVGRSYRAAGLPKGLRLSCAALKLTGVSALLLCLLEPTWSAQRAKPGANLLAIVADNSRSLSLQGKDEQEPRCETVRRATTGEKKDWRALLANTFDVRNYLVDSRLEPTQDFHELKFDGNASSLGHALRSLGDRFRGQPLAGVVLLTDGVATDLDANADLSGLPPVYPVLFGKEQPARDLAIAGTSVSQTPFEDAPVTLVAEVNSSGFANEEIVGKLFPVEAAQPGATPKPVAEQTQKAPPETGKFAFRFQFRPEKSGVLFYRLQIAPKTAGAAEATLANNETIVAVDRAKGPHRVLYVAGRPNWEYKFLHRAVESDDQTQLVGLIRIARREPKFEFRGRAGESSNPLFRGFGNQAKDEVEQYDQPVVVRLNTEDELELRGGFPKTAEELFRYKAVILDDIEAEFFTPEQMSLLQRFVSERGGGLLMLGGMESLVEGKFERTAIGDMLPVYLDRRTANGARPAGPLRLSLTREGWLQPWIRLRANEADERQRLASMPGFDVLNVTGSAKPAATVIATVNDGRKDFPALVTQRFGRGRTAALMIGDMWHAGLGNETVSKDLGKAWRQLVRWLVADTPEPLDVRIEPSAEGASQIQVRARDRKFLPLENAAVTVKVQRSGEPADAPGVTLAAEPSATEPGLYEAAYIPRESDGYRVRATVADENGAAQGEAQAGWNTDFAAAEFRSLVPNRALMEAIAKKTGGRVCTPDQLDELARELPSRTAPVVETWKLPLWHTPVMFVFALGCLIGEWGVRRWKGLA